MLNKCTYYNIPKQVLKAELAQLESKKAKNIAEKDLLDMTKEKVQLEKELLRLKLDFFRNSISVAQHHDHQCTSDNNTDTGLYQMPLPTYSNTGSCTPLHSYYSK